MFKKIKGLSVIAMFALAMLVLPVAASAVTVSGTVTDASGQEWINSAYVFTFLPPPGGVPLGTGESTTTVAGVLNSSGAFSGVVLGNNDVLGGFWQCNITAPTGQTFGVVFRITASSSSLSTVISAASPLLGLVPQTFTTISGSVTLSSQTPSTTRDVIGAATLTYAGIITIGGGTGNVTAIRGVTTLGSTSTLNAGYLYGTQGKVVVTGTLTTQSGGGIVAGIFGQLDLTSSTLTSAGLTAPGAFDMGSGGPSASIGNLHGIVITNSTSTIAGSAIHVGTTSAGFTNFLSVDDTSGTLAVSTGSPGTCTNGGWIQVVIGSTQRKVPLCL